jgi:hypothetical protein
LVTNSTLPKQLIMKKKHVILLGFGFLGLGSSCLWAQKGPVSSGGQATGSGGTVSYSIGQVDYLSQSGSNGALTQGIQQPYEIQILTGIENAGIALSCKVYPNPASDFLLLQLSGLTTEHMRYALFSIDGKLITQHQITDNTTEITLAGLPNSAYLVKIFNSDEAVKTFKISKTN